MINFLENFIYNVLDAIITINSYVICIIFALAVLSLLLG